MTNLTRYSRLFSFVKKYGRVRINAYCGPYPKVRGRAHLFRTAKPLIELRAPKPLTDRVYADLCSALIHEYGHCLLRLTPHSEREAWTWGRRSVPRECVPRQWGMYRRASLNSYPISMRDLRRCSAIGKSWKWAKKKKYH